MNSLSKVFESEKPFIAKGPLEGKRLVEIMQPFLKSGSIVHSFNCTQIFEKGPCLGMDNYFRVMTS